MPLPDLDTLVNRRNTNSIKWDCYPPDVLPMWVADMDFQSPEAVVSALQRRVAHGIFGYGGDPLELRGVITRRLDELYGWQVPPEALVFIPGVITGFNLALRACTKPGDGLLVQTPVYPPILNAHGCHGLEQHVVELLPGPDGHYAVDIDRMRAGLHPSSRMFLFCNPQNPTGRVFTRIELESMARLCLQHDLWICSDEIHADLLRPGYRHIPIASLGREIEARTITLMAPSKTYNIAGLDCAVAIIPDAGLRQRYDDANPGLVGHVNILGLEAALAAYRDSQEWLSAVLAYLDQNYQLVCSFVAEHLPGIRVTQLEGTYLAWLDCRSAGLGKTPAKFFEENGRVGMNEGAHFGAGGEGFVRLNFGCPRGMLLEALQRMQTALESQLIQTRALW